MLWISQLAEKCGDLRFKNQTGRRVGRCRSLLKLCLRQHYGQMRKILFSLLLIILSVSGCESATGTADRVTISVQNAEPGAPVKFGIPFPKGELYSRDRVQVLDARGIEIASTLRNVIT